MMKQRFSKTNKLYNYKLSTIKKLDKDLYHRLLDYSGKYKKELMYGPGKDHESRKATKPELMVARILKKNKIAFKREFEVLKKYFDFYLIDYNILIECDGIYWHDKSGVSEQLMHIQNRVNDIVKNALAAAKEIPLIRVWEDEIDEAKLIAEINRLYSEQSNHVDQIELKNLKEESYKEDIESEND